MLHDCGLELNRYMFLVMDATQIDLTIHVRFQDKKRHSPNRSKTHVTDPLLSLKRKSLS